MYYIMLNSYYVMHKLFRYAKNVLRYAAIITLCVVITLCGVTHDHAVWWKMSMYKLLSTTLHIFEIFNTLT